MPILNEHPVVGIDVGTSSVKAALFSPSGEILDIFVSPYPSTFPDRSYVEQDPADWVARINGAMEQFSQSFDLSRVAAIGICSQVNTHVFVDGTGRPLAPAIVWRDGRSASIAERIDQSISDGERLEWWGAPLPIDASHCLSRMAWMKENRPEVWDRTKWVMSPKDFCVMYLTGEVASDPLANVGLIGRDMAYISPLLERVQDGGGKLPSLRLMTDLAGQVRAGLAGAGIPVAVGTMDAWAGMLGTGVPHEEAGFYLGGTSEIIGIASNASYPTPGVMVFPKYDRTRLHAGPTQSGGASMLWVCRLIGKTPIELSELVAASELSDHIPLFLPHLQGERAPIWDADARGMFLDLDEDTGPGELARAVFEGVAFSARWLFESLVDSACMRPNLLRGGGGGFRSGVWNQLRSDALQVELHRVSTRDPGVLGAAGLAEVACGLHPTVGAALDGKVKIDRVYAPDPGKRDYFDKKFKRYKEAYLRNRKGETSV